MQKRAQNPLLTLQNPLWIVCPALAVGNWLKKELLKNEAPLFNVQFITPPILCKLLMRGSSEIQREISSNESKWLARTFLRGSNRPGLASAPQLLVETDQMLLRSGQEGFLLDPTWNKLLSEFNGLLEKADFCLAEKQYACLSKTARETQKETRESFDLILYGFGPRYWDQWNLLSAAAQLAQEANVFLTFPRVVAEKPGLWWLASWEEIAAEDSLTDYPESGEYTDAHEMERFRQIAEFISSHYPTGAIGQGDLLDMTQTGAPSHESVIFHVARDQWDEAGVIAAQALEWLSRHESAPSVGIVLSNNPALAREVYSHFLRWGIPCRNEYGMPQTLSRAQELWRLWLEMIKGELKASDFLRFYLAAGEALCRALDVGFTEVSELETFLADSFGQLLSERLPVIYADERSRSRMPAVLRKFITLWSGDWALPEKMKMEDCRARITTAMEFLQSLHHDPDFESDTMGVRTFLLEFERSGFVEVFREDVIAFLSELSQANLEKTEGSLFAPVTITTPERAESQSWDYLFLGGLYEGVWPRPPRSHPVMTDDICDRINLASQRQSRSGEGQSYFPAGHCALLSAQSRRMLDREQFLNLLASTRKQIACSTARTDRMNNNQPVSPSEFYQRVFSAIQGGILDGKNLGLLQTKTATWRQRFSGSLFTGGSAGFSTEEEILKVREIYERRRNEDLPFDEYSYALNTPPSTPVILSAKQWQFVRQTPARMWYQWLGLESKGKVFNIEDILNLFRGSLFHRWIQEALSTSSEPAPPLRKLREFPEGVVGNLLRQELLRLRQAYEDGGSTFPLQWEYELTRLEWAAETTLKSLKSLLAGKYFGSEIKKGSRNELVTVAVKDARLSSYGKIDLLVSGAPDPGQSPVLQVIDFKTSTSKSSFDRAKNTNLLKSGDYLQVALYGLFYHQDQKDGTMRWIIYNPFFGLGSENSLLEVEQQGGPLFQVLETVQTRGIFGQLEAMDEDYGIPAELPVACLPVDKAILKKRWEKTFGLEETEADDE